MPLTRIMGLFLWLHETYCRLILFQITLGKVFQEDCIKGLQLVEQNKAIEAEMLLTKFIEGEATDAVSIRVSMREGSSLNTTSAYILQQYLAPSVPYFFPEKISRFLD